MLNKDSLPWKDIYNLPRKVTIDIYTRIFQYKCLNNILYLNNVLYKMNLTESPLCSYCNQHNETIHHLFLECNHTKSLWHEVQLFFNPLISLPHLSIQSAIVGFFEVPKEDFMLTNIILLSFKIVLYKQRNKSTPNLIQVVNSIKTREVIERCISKDDAIKNKIHTKKWQRIQTILK